MPNVCLSDEHQSYIWANSNDIENIVLMDGAREALQHYRAMIVKKRAGASEFGVRPDFQTLVWGQA